MHDIALEKRLSPFLGLGHHLEVGKTKVFELILVLKLNR